MMKKILLSMMCAILLPLGMMAQTVTLTFTGKDANNNRVQLDRVTITNLTKGWQETLYWPDTTLTMQNGTGIHDVDTGRAPSLQLSQNNPNPFNGTTDVLLTVADAGMVVLEIADANGRIVGTHRVRPQLGAHLFRVTLSAAGTYVMTARQNGKTSSIKMVNNGGGNGECIEYVGVVEAQNFAPLQPKSGTRGNTTSPFNFGDQMEYVGYATINGVEISSERISQAQSSSQTFMFQFDAAGHTLPTVITSPVTNFSSTSATCGGIVTSDGGATVIARGVCWRNIPNPTIANSHTTNGTGMGNFTSSLTGLIANTTYFVRAYATNGVGTAYGSEVSFTTIPTSAFTCGTSTLTDADGNIYNTVQIGQQCWMKENLRTTKYADGTFISPGSSIVSTNVAYWYYPNSDASNEPTYGLVYNWPAVMHGNASSSTNPSGVQGVCPTGWHVPSDAEWTQLTDYVSSQSQYVCGSDNTQIAKALASTTDWPTYTGNCTVGNTPSNNNSTGFSALPAGTRHGTTYDGFGIVGHFYSSTGSAGGGAWRRYISFSSAFVRREIGTTNEAYSVRCLRD